MASGSISATKRGTVRNCLLIGNEDAGLYSEISYGLHAHDNVVIGNGLAPRSSAWGSNGGISMSSSAGCVIERNLILANKEGVQFREQRRTTPRIGDKSKKEYAIWNHDNVVRNNVIACNRDMQMAGWFDQSDGSHWPRAMGKQKRKGDLEAGAPQPEKTDITRLDKKPEGMALEDLRLSLEQNLYYAKPGQRLFQWGCLWHDQVIYESLEAVQAALSLESGSRLEEPQFADWTALDLRVKAGCQAVQMKCYPRGKVPGVRMGVME